MAKTGATIQVGNQVLELLSETATIGREADNMIVLGDASVSSHHAEIIFRGGQHLIRDLGSTNGTRVNGLAAKEAALKGGDVISFGTVQCAFSVDAKPGEAAAKAKGGARGNLLLYCLGFAALTLFVASFLVGKRDPLSSGSKSGVPQNLESVRNSAIDVPKGKVIEVVEALHKRLATDGENKIRDIDFAFDYDTGQISFFARLNRSISYSFKVGDIDPNRIYLNQRVGHREIRAYTIDDINTVVCTVDSQTRKQRGFDLDPINTEDSDKIANAIIFLAKVYQNVNLKLPDDPIERIAHLLNKKYRGVQVFSVHVKNGELIVKDLSVLADYDGYILQQVRVLDLDPDKFAFTKGKNEETPSYIELKCSAGKQAIVTTVKENKSRSQNVASMDLKAISGLDAKQIVDAVTELCTRAGWKHSQF